MLLEKSKISAIIVRIGKSSKSIRDNTQTVLAHIAGHTYQHGDCALYNKLYANTTGMNRKRMVQYIEANGFAKLKNDGTFNTSRKKRREADFADGAAVVEYLMSQPAWYVNADEAPKIRKDLDILAAIDLLNQKITKGKATGNVVKVEFADVKEKLQQLQEAIVA